MDEQLKAFWKRLLSYTKKTWGINDYPLRYKKQVESLGEYNVGELKPWVVGYLEHNIAPRPGEKVSLSYADTSQINELEERASDFFEKILDINYYDCFISDESSLLDFNKDDGETLNKINLIYNLGLTEIGDGNIVRLLKMIKDNN
jgi:hypothetical protein